MGKFGCAELVGALSHCDAVVTECSRSREWIVATMAPFPQMRRVVDVVVSDPLLDDTNSPFPA